MAMETNLQKFLDGQQLSKLVVVASHLWLEHLLLRSLFAVLPNADVLRREKGVGFPLLVSLCEAHGVIEPPLADVLRRVNALRNKCAHQASFKPTDRDWENLRAAVQPLMGSAAAGPDVPGESDYDEPLHLIATLLETRARAVGATDLDLGP